MLKMEHRTDYLRRKREREALVVGTKGLVLFLFFLLFGLWTIFS